MFAENVLFVFRFVDQAFPSNAVVILRRRCLNELSYFYELRPDKIISSVASGLLAIRVSPCLSKEASTKRHCVSHCVGPTSSMTRASWSEHHTLISTGVDSQQLTNNQLPLLLRNLISILTNPPISLWRVQESPPRKVCFDSTFLRICGTQFYSPILSFNSPRF
jgi:hypothetical protein